MCSIMHSSHFVAFVSTSSSDPVTSATVNQQLQSPSQMHPASLWHGGDYMAAR
jgi:hypothetical protein